MDDSDIKQLMQEIEFVLKRNQNEKYLRVYCWICGGLPGSPHTKAPKGRKDQRRKRFPPYGRGIGRG